MQIQKQGTLSKLLVVEGRFSGESSSLHKTIQNFNAEASGANRPDELSRESIFKTL